MKNDGGGPAFPTHASGAQWTADDGKTFNQHEPEPGMSLLDYFAGQALCGLLASHAGIGINTTIERSVGSMAYSIAVYTLAAREARLKAVANG